MHLINWTLTPPPVLNGKFHSFSFDIFRWIYFQISDSWKSCYHEKILKVKWFHPVVYFFLQNVHITTICLSCCSDLTWDGWQNGCRLAVDPGPSLLSSSASSARPSTSRFLATWSTGAEIFGWPWPHHINSRTRPSWWPGTPVRSTQKVDDDDDEDSTLVRTFFLRCGPVFPCSNWGNGDSRNTSRLAVVRCAVSTLGTPAQHNSQHANREAGFSNRATHQLWTVFYYYFIIFLRKFEILKVEKLIFPKIYLII